MAGAIGLVAPGMGSVGLASGGGDWWAANPPPSGAPYQQVIARTPSQTPGSLAALGQPLNSAGPVASAPFQPAITQGVANATTVGQMLQTPMSPALAQTQQLGQQLQTPQPGTLGALATSLVQNQIPRGLAGGGFNDGMLGGGLPWWMPQPSASNGQPAQSGYIQMRAPNGDTSYVHPDQVDHYASMGATRL